MFVNQLIKEIDARKLFFTNKIDTVYFGGGTPSVLSINYLEKILMAIFLNFDVNRVGEFTIEINPESVNYEYLKGLHNIGFNRLSIGIQSFDNDILKYLNRIHDRNRAIESIEQGSLAGFTNLSADLIYGIPNQSIQQFESDLSLLKSLNVCHISSYHLGIEDNTYFGKLKKNKKLIEIDEKESEKFFNFLIEWTSTNGYEHYEISNFAKNNQYSKHNSNYWFGVPYIGLGPSAHSFDGGNRFLNISNLNKYLSLSYTELSTPEIDELSTNDRYNELIMLNLRTKWGLKLADVKSKFSDSYYKHVQSVLSKFIDSPYIRVENGTIYLTKRGLFASDYVISEFFV